MRRIAFALVVFVVLEYFGPLTPIALTLITLFATVEVVGMIVLHRMGLERLPQRPPRRRLLPSH